MTLNMTSSKPRTPTTVVFLKASVEDLRRDKKMFQKTAVLQLRFVSGSGTSFVGVLQLIFWSLSFVGHVFNFHMEIVEQAALPVLTPGLPSAKNLHC